EPGALLEPIAFANDNAMVLHPVNAVLQPAVQMTFGQYYTNERQLPVNVLAFGGMNRMRLASNASFRRGDETEVDYLDYSATVEVPLPDVEGPVTVYSQFQNTSHPVFSFTSNVLTATVIRDATVPRVLQVEVGAPGLRQGSDGTRWV